MRILPALLLTLLLLALPRPAGAQPVLGPGAEISLLTCSAGQDLYTAFGHSALRVRDPDLGLDLVFNYGTFDFHTPGFYTKFLKGQLDYMLSLARYDRFAEAYAEEGRQVRAQVLALDSAQRQAVFGFLVENERPENRFYRYDFFFDNCATRIRDLLREVAGASFAQEDSLTDKDFRDLMDPCLEERPWGGLGIYLALGSPGYRATRLSEHAFLPDHLELAFDQASLPGPGGRRPLVAARHELVAAAPLPEAPFWSGPGALFWLLLAAGLLLSAWGWRQGRMLHGFDLALFVPLALAGYILLFLWFGTEHKVMRGNLNVLWALPLHLPMVFFAGRRLKSWAARFYGANGLLALLLIPGFALLPQALHPSVYPLLLLISARSSYIYFFWKKSLR